jgi:uncharacterized Ntn-hydrolase superfamily protein
VSALLLALLAAAPAGGRGLVCSTFSIAAVDTVTGECGVAVASRVLAVGHIVPWAGAGTGAVATQALVNTSLGPLGLELLASGAPAGEVLDSLVASDPGSAQRQLGVVDAAGGSATFTGAGAMSWAGGVAGPGYAIQGNILTGPGVVEAMEAAYLATPGPLASRLLAALQAGDAAGGDSRGRQSAALLVSRAGGGFQGVGDRLVDVRIDDHPDPVGELARVYRLWEYNFLFEVYLGAGREPETGYALGIMDRVLAESDPDAETLNTFAWVLASRGLEPARALELAHRAHEMEPEDMNIVDTLAEALHACGRHAEAVTWETEALSREPDNVWFAEQLRKFTEAMEATGRAPLEP